MSLENLIIDYDENKEEILHWTKLKGEYRYVDVVQFLTKQKIQCSWANVTYYIKYDKRILINSFKYIVFLEELYKSFISQHTDIEIKRIINYEFKEALNGFISIETQNQYDDMDVVLLKNEIKTINSFRNRVVHNKMLLNHSYNGKSLEEVLNIFIKILPKSYRSGYINDMNSCSKNITSNLWHIELEELKNEII